MMKKWNFVLIIAVALIAFSMPVLASSHDEGGTYIIASAGPSVPCVFSDTAFPGPIDWDYRMTALPDGDGIIGKVSGSIPERLRTALQEPEKDTSLISWTHNGQGRHWFFKA
jgi:hypothetical protein